MADAEASTFVPATVVRNAKPLAWLVTSASEVGRNRMSRHHEQHGEHDVAECRRRRRARREPVEVLLLGGDGDDAGRHDEREVAGEQRRDRRLRRSAVTVRSRSQVAQEAALRRRTCTDTIGGRPGERLVVGQERLGGDGDEEDLERDEHDDVDQHGRRRACGEPCRQTLTRLVRPSAQIMPSSRISTSMRPSGRGRRAGDHGAGAARRSCPRGTGSATGPRRPRSRRRIRGGCTSG